MKEFLIELLITVFVAFILPCAASVATTLIFMPLIEKLVAKLVA